MKTRTNHGSPIDLFRPEYHMFKEPVPCVLNGLPYWLYRSGGYCHESRTYGRAGTIQDAWRIIIKQRNLSR